MTGVARPLLPVDCRVAAIGVVDDGVFDFSTTAGSTADLSPTGFDFSTTGFADLSPTGFADLSTTGLADFGAAPFSTLLTSLAAWSLPREAASADSDFFCRTSTTTTTGLVSARRRLSTLTAPTSFDSFSTTSVVVVFGSVVSDDDGSQWIFQIWRSRFMGGSSEKSKSSRLHLRLCSSKCLDSSLRDLNDRPSGFSIKTSHLPAEEPNVRWMTFFC